ncbi:MAG: hypothetical protein JSU77_08670 [Fidelibacterota bacterium]|nr:MAG: hypothetical protein JSU77_08670 [Candidatus Neomarinimicrobiota bacterium]
MASGFKHLISALPAVSRVLLFTLPLAVLLGQGQPVNTIYTIDGLKRGRIISHTDSTILMVDWQSPEVFEIPKSSSVLITRFERDVTAQFLDAGQLARSEELRAGLKRGIRIRKIFIFAVALPAVLLIIGGINFSIGFGGVFR